MKEKNLTIVGTVDPISAVSKLRKLWPTYLISVGPAKEPEKKEEPKKEEGKKDEPKKEEKKDEAKTDESKNEDKKDEEKKEGQKEEEKKDEPKEGEKKNVPGIIMPYRPYYPPMHTYYNYQPPYHHSIEENPNACVIC